MRARYKIGLAVVALAVSSAATAAQDQTVDFTLPKGCQQASGHMAGMMGDMDGMMGKMMTSAGGHMNEATKGYMQAIVDMHPPMVRGAMAEDPDLAFTCSMIAHHKGAIAMAKVQLQYGKDDEAKETAQKTIDAQSAEVDQMTKWVEEHARQ